MKKKDNDRKTWKQLWKEGELHKSFFEMITLILFWAIIYSILKIL